MENSMKLEFMAIPENEGFARVAVAAFITPLNPTLEEISDVKTAVSEAVTNAVIHAYEQTGGTVTVRCSLEGDLLHMEVEDFGKGIENVKQAMEPLYTTAGGERAGLGFAVMQSFTDNLRVISRVGKGTTVTMKKRLSVRTGTNGKQR